MDWKVIATAALAALGGSLLTLLSSWIGQKIRASHEREIKESERQAALTHESIRKPLLDHCQSLLEGHSEAFWRWRGGQGVADDLIDSGIMRSVAVIRAAANALNIPSLGASVEQLGTSAFNLRTAMASNDVHNAEEAMDNCVTCYSNVLLLLLDPKIQAIGKPDLQAVAHVEREVRLEGPIEEPT